jgi:hypothetical protein
VRAARLHRQRERLCGGQVFDEDARGDGGGRPRRVKGGFRAQLLSRASSDLRAERIEQRTLLLHEREHLEDVRPRHDAVVSLASLERGVHVGGGEESLRGAEEVALLERSPDLLRGVHQELHPAPGRVLEILLALDENLAGDLVHLKRRLARGIPPRRHRGVGEILEHLIELAQFFHRASRVSLDRLDRVRGRDRVEVAPAPQLLQLSRLLRRLQTRLFLDLSNLRHLVRLEQRVRVLLVRRALLVGEGASSRRLRERAEVRLVLRLGRELS